MKTGGKDALCFVKYTCRFRVSIRDRRECLSYDVPETAGRLDFSNGDRKTILRTYGHSRIRVFTAANEKPPKVNVSGLIGHGYGVRKWVFRRRY